MKEKAPLRPKKEDDQEKTEECYMKFVDLIRNNPGTEVTLWMSAITKLLVKVHIVSGCTYEEYKEELNRAIDHYKSGWINED